MLPTSPPVTLDSLAVWGVFFSLFLCFHPKNKMISHARDYSFGI